MFDEVDGLIVPEENLYTTLNKNLSAYTAIYNKIVADEEMQIPVSLFLVTRLQAAKQSKQG